jgi:hypothetical protein
LVSGNVHRWPTLSPAAGIEGSGTGGNNLLWVWVCTGEFIYKPLTRIGALGVAVEGGNHGGLTEGLTELGHGLGVDVLLSFPEGA